MITHLNSFDGTENVVADYVRPDRYRHLFSALDGSVPAIPRGGGLSYCAASAGVGVRSVSSLLFNRILAFDEKNGLINVEAGMRVGDLYRFTASRGWILPVMPGHPSITVGGCIGCNVHGKNHSREGNFINVIESLTLFHPDHGEINCSRTREPELFRLTVGGFGLAGFITSVRLRLQRLIASAVLLRRRAVANLTETVAIMESEGQNADLLYSWNNFNVEGHGFGQGFVYIGHAESQFLADKFTFRLLSSEGRSNLPLTAYTELTTRSMLALYRWWSQRLTAEEKLISLAAATFPPNGKEFYFRLFGRKGFREYQVLVPRSRWNETKDVLPDLVRRHNVPITLASLKLFRGQPDLLHFDGTGISLTLDAPEGKRTLRLFQDLDALTLSIGGIVNLSKDSRLETAFVRQVFPGYERFKKELAAFDPKRRFDSSLRRRLGV